MEEQTVWVIQTKKTFDTAMYAMSLFGHHVYSKGDNPDHSGIIFETEKQAKRSLSRYDIRYRDNYEIVTYTMTLKTS